MAIYKGKERDMVLEMWSLNIPEKRIAKIMKISAKQVHDYIYVDTVSISAITNEQILAQEMNARGKTEDEIAGILDIEVQQVRSFLERKEG